MRLRVRHAARAGFAVTRPDETAHDGPTSAELSDCLVAVLGVEGSDAGDVAGTAAAAAETVRSRADDLSTTRVLLVPDPAFAAEDAAPPLVERVTAETATALDRTTPDGFEAVRAPLGTYVATEIETKAHPFADSTHTVRPRGDAGHPAEDAEWQVVTPAGDRRDADAASLSAPLANWLRATKAVDTTGRDSADDTLETLAAAGLAEAPPSAPGAQTRWLPRGVVVRETIAAAVAGRIAETGASPVATPPVADLGEPVVGDAPATGPPHYAVTRGDERLLVRPRPEVGLRAAVRDALETGADCPVRLAETPGRAVRPDGRGGTRPTVLTATASGDAALATVREDAELAVAACAALGVADGAVCRLAADAPVDDDWVASLAAALDRPVLLERSPEASPERAVEVTVVSTAGGDAPLALGRVRLDTAGGATLVDGDGDDHPWLVATEPVGRIEAATAALLANRLSNPLPLPVALAPTQVRLLPLESAHRERCLDLATRLRAADARADVDDRDRPVAARLDAAADVPFVAVVGDREADRDRLTVTDTAAETEREMDVEALRERVAAAVGDWPRLPSRLPPCLSARSTLGVDGADGGDGDDSQR